MNQVLVIKIPPLLCPQCGSTKVKRGFNKRVKRAYIPDGKTYCYDCMKITDKNGKVSEHNYHSHLFPRDEP